MLHAIDHSLAAIDLDDERALYLGPDHTANLLKVVVLTGEAEDEPIVIHAMAMWPGFAGGSHPPTKTRMNEQ